MSTSQTTQADSDLAQRLKEMGKENCPNCGRRLDRDDLGWNYISTGEGPLTTRAHIECQACDMEVAWWPSLWPGGNDATFEEFMGKALPDWKKVS